MDLWNVKNLQPPPVMTCTVTTKEIDIRLLDIVLKEGTQFFENERHLSTEAALLSRSVYRFKTKFRSSKDFKSVEILNRILRTYLDMRIPVMLKILSDSVPRNYRVNKVSILTKNMMDFVLVRLQGLGKILCKLLDICKMVSCWMQQRLRLGHFWKIALVVFATTSRIFVVTKSVLKYTCVKWLPDGYNFPSRLDEWLDVDWLDLESNVIEILDDEPILSYLKLTDSDDEVEFCDEYIIVKDGSPDEVVPDEKISIDLTDSTIDLSQTSEIDVGEVINVSSEKKPKRNRKKKSNVVGKAMNRMDGTPKNRKRKLSPLSFKNKRRKKLNDMNAPSICVSESPKKQKVGKKKKKKLKRL